MLRLLLVILVVSLGFRMCRRYGSDLEVYIWDVGQGDAALIRFPGGKTMLIDAGGGFGEWDLGSRVLLPELARLGVLSLDIALLSHPDQDHGYGFLGLWRELRAGELWVNGREDLRHPKPLLRKLLRSASAENVGVEFFNEVSERDIGGARVRLFPLGTAGAASNNRTLAVLLEWKGVSFAFTGDMESDAESAFFDRIDGPVTVLKVAHHGSRTSSFPAALARARPTWSVISSGAGNHYGHPHVSVLERLQNFDGGMLRTDFHGFAHFVVHEDGRLTCETGKGGCGVGRRE